MRVKRRREMSDIALAVASLRPSLLVLSHLILDGRLDKGGVFPVGVEFAEGSGLLEGPGEKGHGVNVGVAVGGDSRRVVEVGNGVVAIVLRWVKRRTGRGEARRGDKRSGEQ